MSIEKAEGFPFILITIVSELCMISPNRKLVFKIRKIHLSDNNIIRFTELTPVFHINGHIFLINLTIIRSLNLDGIGIDFSCFPFMIGWEGITHILSVQLKGYRYVLRMIKRGQDSLRNCRIGIIQHISSTDRYITLFILFPYNSVLDIHSQVGSHITNGHVRNHSFTQIFVTQNLYLDKRKRMIHFRLCSREIRRNHALAIHHIFLLRHINVQIHVPNVFRIGMISVNSLFLLHLVRFSGYPLASIIGIFQVLVFRVQAYFIASLPNIDYSAAGLNKIFQCCIQAQQ